MAGVMAEAGGSPREALLHDLIGKLDAVCQELISAKLAGRWRAHTVQSTPAPRALPPLASPNRRTLQRISLSLRDL